MNGRGLLVASIAMVALGCGGGKAKLETGVAESKPVSEMSDAEFQQACRATQAYYNEVLDDASFRKLSCTMTAMMTAQMAGKDNAPQAVCDKALSACDPKQVNIDEFRAQMGSACAKREDVFPPGCKATVAQFEACQRETVDRTNTFISSFSCASLETSSALLKPEGPACKAFKAVCSRAPKVAASR